MNMAKKRGTVFIAIGSIFIGANCRGAEKKSSKEGLVVSLWSGYGYACRGQEKTMHTRSVGYNDKDFSLFGIFDGYTQAAPNLYSGGAAASAFCAQNIVSKYVELSKKNSRQTGMQPFRCLRHALIELDAEFLEKNPKSEAGTTALIALLEKNQLYMANLGNSRGAVFGGEKIVITEEHKPLNIGEKIRIDRVNSGIVEETKRIKISEKNSLEFGQHTLVVSRSIGDVPCKRGSYKGAIIACPTIKKIGLITERYAVVLATESFWKAMNLEEVEKEIKKGEITEEDVMQWKQRNQRQSSGGLVSLEGSSEQLKVRASKLCDVAYDKGLSDNVSVMVVYFDKKFADPPNVTPEDGCVLFAKKALSLQELERLGIGDRKKRRKSKKKITQ
jgi:protein phosphatase 1L